MVTEFHIVASNYDTCFTMEGGAGPLEFSSLFEAARHARSACDSDNGLVVISDESGTSLNRIPFNIAC